MSAYSASAPVMASTTEASAMNAIRPWPVKKRSPYSGDSALMIAGSRMTSAPPDKARTTNHSAMTGPNSFPTSPVPYR